MVEHDWFGRSGLTGHKLTEALAIGVPLASTTWPVALLRHTTLIDPLLVTALPTLLADSEALLVSVV